LAKVEEARDGARASEDEDDEVEISEDEEDGDPGDLESGSEDEEVEDSEIVACELTTESAAAWLDPLPKDQDILKEKGKT
jgi:hypothetical protein